MLEVRALELDGVCEIRPPRLADPRGFFSETWNAQAWRAAGIDMDFVQDNHSYSKERGVLRGLHYQLPPVAQDKLVRVTKGAIFDVVVDIRRGSPSYGRWLSAIVSAAEWNQLLVPKGFAHGFLTLEAGTEVQYKVTAPYDASQERAIRFDDPTIGITWPIDSDLLVLSDKDRSAPFLSQADVFD